MASASSVLPQNHDVFSRTLTRVCLPAVLFAAAVLSGADIWALLGHWLVGARLVVVMVAWFLVLSSVIVMVIRRRDLTSGISIASQAAALIASTAIFGALRGTLVGGLTGLVVAVFFFIAVAANMLRGVSQTTS